MRAALPVILLLVSTLTLASGALAQTEAALTIQGFAFRPARLEVDPGQTVRVTNLDSSPHSATGQGFDSGVLDKDGAAPMTAPSAPGEYPYVCKIHGSMRGTLVVRAPATATTTTPASPTPTSPEPTPTTTTTTTGTTPASPTPTTAAATSPSTPSTTSGTSAAATPTNGDSATPTPTPAPGADTPGPGAALVVSALAAAVVLFARRR